MVPKEIIPEEPRYVDPDDFGDNDWMYPVTEFEKKALKLTGRVHFKSEAQAKRLRAIESRSTGSSPKYPQEYLKQVFEWCAKKNKQRTVIILDALISAIRNPDNLTRYYKGEPIEDRSGYADDITW